VRRNGRIVFGVRRAHKTKTRSRLIVSGGRLPLPQTNGEPSQGRGFDENIESEGLELKRKDPANAAHIDKVVAEFKERNRAGEFHDWYDTLVEFFNAAERPKPRRPNSGKTTGDKR